ncbi:MAG: transposase [Pirellulales bacterium]|nr:transposase [Pirellulales bacterium]
MQRRKIVRHFHEVGHLHELTFSCFRRMPLLTNDVWRERLARCISAAGDEEAMELVGFVFMPEHVHLLVHPTSPTPAIGRYPARIKQPFSRQIRGLLEESGSPLLSELTVLERPGKTCFRFWLEGPGFDRNVFSAEAVAASLEYIHDNPVKRGLCRQASDWKWSSARYYLEAPRRQHPGLPVIHDLPEGALT